MIHFETEVSRFMENPVAPFTNNKAENDIRMTKVQLKISGCFRSLGGAQIFCRIRGYLSMCRKHGVSASEALRLLFKGELPAFVGESGEQLLFCPIKISRLNDRFVAWCNLIVHSVAHSKTETQFLS